MGVKTLSIAFALLLASVAYSICPTGDATIHVPAVVTGQEGGLLTITAYIRPGEGAVFTSIEPSVGISTQVSQKNAAIAGLALAGHNLSECDVFFLINDFGASSVDGPSAGLAMATAVRAAAEGKELRDDVAITGAVTPEGKAAAVGGIIDKAQAASRNGMEIMVTPQEEVFENIILRSLSEKYDFQSVQVDDVEGAYRVATSNKGDRFDSKFKLEFKGMPDGLPYRKLNGDELRFSAIALEINRQLELRVRQDGGALAEYRDYFLKEAERNRKIMDAGYPYTAANNGFLSLGTADFLATPPENLNLEIAKSEVAGCLASIPDTPLTSENFQWLMGARVRKAWANDKLEAVSEGEGNFSSSEEKYSALRALYYARTWCLSASMIAKEAISEGGKPVDENALKAIADAQLAEFEGRMQTSPVFDAETLDHLRMAKKEYDGGGYLASLYDLAYASAMSEAFSLEVDGEEAGVQPLGFGADGPKSLWGRIYYSQALYIAAEHNATGIIPQNRQVALLAKYMDLQSENIQKALENADGAPTPKRLAVGNGEKNPEDLAAASIMMVAIVAIAVEFLKKGKGLKPAIY